MGLSAASKKLLKKSKGVAEGLYAPISIAISKSKIRRANEEVRILKKAKAYDNAPNFKNGQPTDAYKTRFMANKIKAKYRKK